jgi:hypothetical protein
MPRPRAHNPFMADELQQVMEEATPKENRREQYDVDPRQYAMVIREMIRHENDVTNHRIMWLLIVQGLIANAYVKAASDVPTLAPMVAVVGVLVAISPFVILYKSYHARGYLSYLGLLAKTGKLPEEWLPLNGWPRYRVKGWRHDYWICPWLHRASDLLDPFFFLPLLLIHLWLFVLMRSWPELRLDAAVLLAVLALVAIVSAVCLLWVHTQSKAEQLE